MTLREMNKLITNMTYNVVLCHEGEFYPSKQIEKRCEPTAHLNSLCLLTMENWTEEELDNSELTAISEIDGIITFYYDV